jgi:L-cysteine S-thiosulfotransferase
VRGAQAIVVCVVGVALTAAHAWASDGPSAASNGVVPYAITGDAIESPLAGLTGDAVRGRAIVANRAQGLCVLCHQVPIDEVRFQGDIGTNLAGVGTRWQAGQLRLRVVDARRLNPQSIMPSYHRVDNLNQVNKAFQTRPILSAQDVEDVVAYLTTLK